MKLSSTSAAKLLFSLCLAIAISAAYLGSGWKREQASLKTQAASATQSREQAQREISELGPILSGGEAALSLSQTLGGLLDMLSTSQVDNRLSIASIAPKTAGGQVTGLTDLEALANPVGNTSLRVVTLSLQGTWRDYAGLRSFLSELRAQPVAITRLVVADSGFELDIKVFGSLS